jgi:hypothetical protein
VEARVINLKEFLDWKACGCPVTHKVTGKVWYVYGTTRRLVSATGKKVIAVQDAPDMPNNQSMRQIEICLMPEDELEVTFYDV